MRIEQTADYWLSRFPAQGYGDSLLRFVYNEIKSGAYNHRPVAEREAMQRAIEQLTGINQPQVNSKPAAKQRKR